MKESLEKLISDLIEERCSTKGITQEVFKQGIEQGLDFTEVKNIVLEFLKKQNL